MSNPAVELLASIGDALRRSGIERPAAWLVRIAACLIVEEPGTLPRFVAQHTIEDGADLEPALARYFARLAERGAPVELALSPSPSHSGPRLAEVRARLIDCRGLDGATLPPTIFGMLAEGLLDSGARRREGTHYTRETDIAKVLRAAFLDELEAEVGLAATLDGPAQRARVATLLERLAGLRLLDPACGCGDFLIVAYAELRRLERELVAMLGPGSAVFARISLAQLAGVEIDPDAAEHARLGLWLLERRLGPIGAGAPTIVCANALRIDWREVVDPARCTHVIGNPPFVGKKARTPAQAEDMRLCFGAGHRALDYVCAFFVKAAAFIAGTAIRVAFVATNSISQGEQPGLLWPALQAAAPIEILAAHRSFAWSGTAAVHVVVVVFAVRPPAPAARAANILWIHDEDPPRALRVETIGPYLTPGAPKLLRRRPRPRAEVPAAAFGNMPNDGGHLLLSETEARELLERWPAAAGLVRPFVSARAWIHAKPRFCLWLRDAEPHAYLAIDPIRARVEAVAGHRCASGRAATRARADQPALFGEIRQPDGHYILIPRHPSADRRHVPMGFCSPEQIVADSCICVAGADHYHLGVLMSAMHMAWIRQLCGRIKSDLRYSVRLVYNNFPWPEAPAPARVHAVAEAARAVLEARTAHPRASLATLYDPRTMPGDLHRAHQNLDFIVDRAYGAPSFTGDLDRLAFAFDRIAASS